MTKYHPRQIFMHPLVRLRKERGFKRQSDLAKAIGLTTTVIARIETGVTEFPRASTILKLSTALNIHEIELLAFIHEFNKNPEKYRIN